MQVTFYCSPKSVSS